MRTHGPTSAPEGGVRRGGPPQRSHQRCGPVACGPVGHAWSMDEGADGDAQRLADARQRVHDPGAWVAKSFGELDSRRLVAAFERDVPPDALVVAARWWQLENYLRLLIYINLKGLLGGEWTTPLRQATGRHAQAASRSYMASADDGYLLAHLDVSALLDLISTYWQQCESGLGVPAAIWQGRIEEVKPIRHRIAHCRRPHADDVDRLEQLLRDIEPAAGATLRSYTRWWEPTYSDDDDVIVRDWVDLDLPDAHRLVPHGHDNKGIHFSLMCSRLRWAEETSTITGAPGWFWVMHVYLRDCSLYIDDYLRESSVTRGLPLVGHVVQPSLPLSPSLSLPFSTLPLCPLASEPSSRLFLHQYTGTRTRAYVTRGAG